MEHCVLQNNAVDIYNTFFSDCPLLSSSDYEQPTVKIVCTFKYRNPTVSRIRYVTMRYVRLHVLSQLSRSTGPNRKQAMSRVTASLDLRLIPWCSHLANLMA